MYLKQQRATKAPIVAFYKLHKPGLKMIGTLDNIIILTEFEMEWWTKPVGPGKAELRGATYDGGVIFHYDHEDGYEFELDADDLVGLIKYGVIAPGN